MRKKGETLDDGTQRMNIETKYRSIGRKRMMMLSDDVDDGNNIHTGAHGIFHHE